MSTEETGFSEPDGDTAGLAEALAVGRETEPGRLGRLVRDVALAVRAQARLDVLEAAIDRTVAGLIQQAVAVQRERAETAEAKLAAVVAYCQDRFEEWSLHLDDQPEKFVRIAGILAIISEEPQP